MQATYVAAPSLSRAVLIVNTHLTGSLRKCKDESRKYSGKLSFGYKHSVNKIRFDIFKILAGNSASGMS